MGKTNFFRKRVLISQALSLLFLFSSCVKKDDESSLSQKVLYIASGQCNSGQGITTYSTVTSSRVISKVDLSTGAFSAFMDLSSSYVGGDFAPQTAAAALVDSGDYVYALLENPTITSERKILRIPKSSPYNATSYSNDPLAFTSTATNITRDLVVDTDGTMLFSKSVAIEKIGTNVLRVPMGANPWVNAPGSTCATSNRLITTLKLMPTYTGATAGKIIYAHQGASAALNRLGIISSNGYATTADCLGGVQISSTAHTNATGVTGPLTFGTGGVSPTAMVYIPNSGSSGGKLVVSYSASVATDVNNNTNLVFAIVMWTVSETGLSTASLSSPVVLYNDWTNIYGVSAMAYDSETGYLYVATPSQPGIANVTTAGYGYKIEKFVLDLTTPSLTLIRPNNKPFLDRNSSTKCISGMAIGTM